MPSKTLFPGDSALDFSSTLATSGGSSSYLVGPKIDAAAVLGGGVLISVALYVAWRTDVYFLLAATLFAMLADLPHVLQTSMRVWLDPQERVLHGRRYLISLFLIAAGVIATAVTGRLRVLLMIWIGWQFVHVVKQHYGMLSIYAAKAHYDGKKWLIKYVLLLGCTAPFIYRLRLGMRFSEYVIFGQRMPFSSLSVATPPIPLAVVLIIYVAFGCFVIAFVREQFRIAAAHQTPLPPIAWATVAIAVLSYNISYLFVSDLYALILIATSVHSLQYHVISWRRNFGRFSQPKQQGEDKLLLAWLSRRETLPLYILLLFTLGAILANGEIILLGVIPTIFVMHHFYMDGFIWKGKLNPELPVDIGVIEKSTRASA
jgi:hypothetical protein